MSGARLQRCPFCGGNVYVNTMRDSNEAWFYLSHRAKLKDPIECRVFMESDKYRDGATEKEIKAIRAALVEKWNRRCEQ